MEVKHCVMDLEDMIKSMQDRLQRNVDDVKNWGRELTEVEDARFEVGSLLLMDIVDDLQGVVAAWKDNAPARRVTEEAIEKGS